MIINEFHIMKIAMKTCTIIFTVLIEICVFIINMLTIKKHSIGANRATENSALWLKILDMAVIMAIYIVIMIVENNSLVSILAKKIIVTTIKTESNIH